MSKPTQKTNHTKSFITAIGIAFALLAFAVLFVAFEKGGLDIRSRAGWFGEKCYTASVTTTIAGKPIYGCPARATLRGHQCCFPVYLTPKVTVTPTRGIVKTTIAPNRPTPTPTNRIDRIQITGGPRQTIQKTTVGAQ